VSTLLAVDSALTTVDRSSSTLIAREIGKERRGVGMAIAICYRPSLPPNYNNHKLRIALDYTEHVEQTPR